MHATTDHCPFAVIGLLGRAGKASVKKTLTELSKLLITHHYQVIISSKTVELLTDDNSYKYVTVLPINEMAAVCDLVIVVGGDGSILQASGIMAAQDTPILGINRGRLGFLADVHPDSLTDQVMQVLGGAYEYDKRVLLAMQIIDNETIVHQDTALNDVVLHAGKSVHTIDFQLKIDGVDVYRQHADGLIVSTPTGSTAYNLSAGGPIVYPTLSTICLAPMYPHTLSSRPILVSDTSVIEIKVHKDNRTQPMVSSDGRASVPLYRGQVLTITKHPYKLTLLHPVGFDFYEACRTKLNWNLYSDEFSLSSGEF